METATRMAERMAEVGVMEERADRLQRERDILRRLARQLAESSDPSKPYELALKASLDGLGFSQGSALGHTADGCPLEPKAVVGMQEDPLNAVEIPTLGSVARSVADRGNPFISHEPRADLFNDELHPAIEGVRGILAVPLQAPGIRLGLLLIYGRDQEQDVDAQDLSFLSTVADMTSMAIIRNHLGRREATRKQA